MSLILSSFGKGFVFLMMIWDYDETFSNFSVVIDIFVFTSNILALIGNFNTNPFFQHSSFPGDKNFKSGFYGNYWSWR
jgi:hypothetical protein